MRSQTLTAEPGLAYSYEDMLTTATVKIFTQQQTK